MDFLARNKEGLAIRQVDIDRPDSQGIDFDSPISAQWEVESVPSFLIYDENGKVTYRGNQAKDQVRDWYNQAQLAHSAEQNPDLSAPYDNTGSSH